MVQIIMSLCGKLEVRLFYPRDEGTWRCPQDVSELSQVSLAQREGHMAKHYQDENICD